MGSSPSEGTRFKNMMLEKRHNKPEDTSEIESLFDFLCLLLSSFFDETKQDFSNLSKKKNSTRNNAAQALRD